MVQILVRLVAPEKNRQEFLHALRAVLRGARQARGCKFSHITQQADDEKRIEYLEEWDEEAELRAQFRSERFLHLLALVETSAEPPVVEFRTVSDIYGLEYIKDPESATSAKSGSIDATFSGRK